MDLFIGLLECPHKMVVGFPQSEYARQGKLEPTFCDLDLEVTYHYVCNIPLDTDQTYSVCEETSQGCKYQELRITGGHLGGYLPHYHFFLL